MCELYPVLQLGRRSILLECQKPSRRSASSCSGKASKWPLASGDRSLNSSPSVQARAGPFALLLLGQALLVGLAARQAYGLSQAAQVFQSQASPQTTARLAGILAQQKALTPLVYSGWLMFAVGAGLTIYSTLRRRIDWPVFGVLFLLMGHLVLFAGLHVLPIVLSSPPPIEELATQYTLRGISGWMKRQASVQTTSAGIAAAGWLVNGIACALAWRSTRSRLANGGSTEA